MGNLLEKSTSKYILNKTNYNYLEKQLLEFANVPMDQIITKDIKVGDFEN